MSSQLFRFLQSQPPQQKVNIPHLPSDLRFLGFQIAQSLEKCNKSHESSIANKLVLNLKALPSNECGKTVVFKNSCILTAQQHHPKHNIEVESQLVNSPNVEAFNTHQSHWTTRSYHFNGMFMSFWGVQIWRHTVHKMLDELEVTNERKSKIVYTMGTHNLHFSWFWSPRVFAPYQSLQDLVHSTTQLYKSDIVPAYINQVKVDLPTITKDSPSKVQVPKFCYHDA